MAIEVKAKLSYLRISPRKVRLVADLVRGKKAVRAVEILSLLSKEAAKPVKKLIESAIANAKNNHELAVDNLRLVKIIVDEGPTLKRWKPRARGRATTIRKRTSHVKLVLEAVAEPNYGESRKKDYRKKTKTIEKNKKQIMAREDRQLANEITGDEEEINKQINK